MGKSQSKELVVKAPPTTLDWLFFNSFISFFAEERPLYALANNCTRTKSLTFKALCTVPGIVIENGERHVDVSQFPLTFLIVRQTNMLRLVAKTDSFIALLETVSDNEENKLRILMEHPATKYPQYDFTKYQKQMKECKLPTLKHRKFFLSLLDCIEDYNALKPGMLITRRSFRCGIMQYNHWGVYIGDGLVIHFDTETAEGRKSDACIHQTTWAEFVKDRGFICVLKGCDLTDENRAECTKRAKQILEEVNGHDDRSKSITYRVLNNNCEHFAKFCLFGETYASEFMSVAFDVGGFSARVIGSGILHFIWDLLVIGFNLPILPATGGIVASALEPLFALIQLLIICVNIVNKTIRLIRGSKFSTKEDAKAFATEFLKMLRFEIGTEVGVIVTALIIIAVSVAVIITLASVSIPGGMVMIIAVFTTLICFGLFLLGRLSKELLFRIWNSIRSKKVPTAVGTSTLDEQSGIHIVESESLSGFDIFKEGAKIVLKNDSLLDPIMMMTEAFVQ